MKKYIIIIIAMLFSLTITAQRKTVTDKLQIPSLKNTEILSTDKDGNLIKGQPIKQKTAQELYSETWTAKSTHAKIDFSTIATKPFDADIIVDNGVHYIAFSQAVDGAIINRDNHTIANTLIYLRHSNGYPKILLFDPRNLKLGTELPLIDGKYDVSKTIIDVSTRKPLINYSDKNKRWFISFVLKPNVKIDANNKKTEIDKAVNYVKNSLYYTSKGGQQATSIKQKIDAKLNSGTYEGTATTLNDNIKSNKKAIERSLNRVNIENFTGGHNIPHELLSLYNSATYSLNYATLTNDGVVFNRYVPLSIPIYIPKPVDWNETNANLPTFIKNKPVIPNFKDSITIGEEDKAHTTIKPTGITFHAYSAFLRRNVKYTIKPTSAPIGLTEQEFTLPNIGGMLATEPSVANQLKGKLDKGTYTGTASNLKTEIDSKLSVESDPKFTAWNKDYNGLINRPDLSLKADKTYVDNQLNKKIGVTALETSDYSIKYTEGFIGSRSRGFLSTFNPQNVQTFAGFPHQTAYLIISRIKNTVQANYLRINPDDITFTVVGDHISKKQELVIRPDKIKLGTLIHLAPSTAPTASEKGMIYFDSTDNKLKCYDGTVWHNLF